MHLTFVWKQALISLYIVFTWINGNTGKRKLWKENHASFIWLWIQVNTYMLRNTTKQQVGVKKKRQTWSLRSLWSRIEVESVNWIPTVCVFYLRLHVGPALAAGQYVLTANDVSLYIYVKVPVVGLLSQVGRTLLAFLCRVHWSWKSISHNWWRPSRINEARKSGQPLGLANQEAISGGTKGGGLCVMLMREPEALE